MVKLLLSDDDVRSGTNMARLIDSAAIQAFSSDTAHLFFIVYIIIYCSHELNHRSHENL